MKNFYRNFNTVKEEKLLEHYITMKYTNINKNDIYIDIES